MLRGDTVKDDSGSHAVCTEQGSSALQVAAAGVVDVIARLPGCAGQAPWCSVSTSKMEDAPALLRLPKSECPDIGIPLPRHTWPKSWSNIEEPVGLVERNL